MTPKYSTVERKIKNILEAKYYYTKRETSQIYSI